MKKVIHILCGIVIVLAIGFVWSYMSNWPTRYKGEFDKFFGSDWTYERLEDEYYDDLSYNTTRYNGTSRKTGGKVKYWGITHNGNYYYINNDTHKYNHKDYIPFKTELRSQKQSLWYEFLDIAVEEASIKLEDRYITKVIGEEYKDAITMDVRCKGYVDKDFLNYLSRSEWLTINIDPAELLICSVHDFSFDINFNQYQYKKLSPEQQKVVEDWMHNIPDRLIKDFTSAARFSVYFKLNEDAEPFRIECEDGVLQEEY